LKRCSARKGESSASKQNQQHFVGSFVSVWLCFRPCHPSFRNSLLYLQCQDHQKPYSSCQRCFDDVIPSTRWVTLDRFAQKGVYWTHAGRHFGLEIAPVWKRAEQEQLEQQAKEDASAGDVSDEDVYQEVREELHVMATATRVRCVSDS
jgi:hypothetical protein